MSRLAVALACLLWTLAPGPDRPAPSPTPSKSSSRHGAHSGLLRAHRILRPDEPISLDLKDADLRDVLHTFSLLTGLNIVVDPEVKGSVTIILHDVPWGRALDLILRANGYGYVIEGNVLRAGLSAKI